MLSTFFKANKVSQKSLINWETVPDLSKQILQERFIPQETLSLLNISNFAAFAKIFNDCKFCGYMTEDILSLLLDVSQHGSLEKDKRTIVRFYYEWASEIHMIQLELGTRKGMVGIQKFYEEMEKEKIDSLIEISEEEFMKLCRDKDHQLNIISKGQDVMIAPLDNLDVGFQQWSLFSIDECIKETRKAEMMLSLRSSDIRCQEYLKKVFAKK